MNEKEKESLLLRIEIQEMFILYILKAGIPALLGSLLYYYAFSSVLNFFTSAAFFGENAMSTTITAMAKVGKIAVFISSLFVGIHIILYVLRNTYTEDIVQRKWKKRLRETTKNLTFSPLEREYIYMDMKKEYQSCKKELGHIQDDIKKRNTHVVTNIKETFSASSKEKLSCSVCSYPIQIENGRITSSCRCKSIQSFQTDQKKTTV